MSKKSHGHDKAGDLVDVEADNAALDGSTPAGKLDADDDRKSAFAKAVAASDAAAEAALYGEEPKTAPPGCKRVRVVAVNSDLAPLDCWSPGGADAVGQFIRRRGISQADKYRFEVAEVTE